MRFPGFVSRHAWRFPRPAVLLALLAALPLCFWKLGPTPWALAWLVFYGLLASAVVAELRTGAPSLWLSLTGAVTGLALAALRPSQTPGLVDASIGATAGFAVVGLAGFAQAHWRVAARGQGSLPEAALFAMAGAWLGWRELPALMLGSFFVLAVGRLAAPWPWGAAPSFVRAFTTPAPVAVAVPWSPAFATAIVIHEVLQHAI